MESCIPVVGCSFHGEGDLPGGVAPKLQGLLRLCSRNEFWCVTANLGFRATVYHHGLLDPKIPD